MDIIQIPHLIGLVIAFLGALIAWLGLRRSWEVDRVAEQAAIQTVQSGTVGHVIEGLNKLVSNLQEDNRVLRESVAACNSKLSAIIAQCEDLKLQIAELSARVPYVTPSPGEAS